MRLRRISLVTAFLCATASATHAQTKPLPAKAKAAQNVPARITKTAAFSGGTQHLSDTHEKGESGAVVIKGDNITVDFGGTVLEGTPPETVPDARKGTGLWITGKNVTLKNVRVRGYKIGLFAQNAPGLRIVNGDFSYNWKQHLKSTTEREDLADWMSFHHNEQNEWLRYGAGMYLDKCSGFSVQNCRATGGQNGLLIARSDNGQATSNEFSFLSGVGLGMYRASGNRILHNKLDWCVRGYSHGIYNRGQDSAALLAFEQCNRNTFAYNSATHGGDGFFLWAGQTTMDTGQGGCNDNVIFGNDFSHSPTNGVEVTFSRNTIANNLIMECWHGIWGGYSYDTKIYHNTFGFNAVGIAIEHGQNNAIKNNHFRRDNEGVYLWQNKSEDPNWGYPKNRDTRSHSYQITDNDFHSILGEAVRLRDTTNVLVASNEIQSRVAVTAAGNTEGLVAQNNVIYDAAPNEAVTKAKNKFSANGEPFHGPPFGSQTMLASGQPLLSSEDGLYLYRFKEIQWHPQSVPLGVLQWGNLIEQLISPYDDDASRFIFKSAPRPLKNAAMPFLKPGQLRGRRYILVDEWGPYDFRAPVLWPREASTIVPNTQTFEILGPPGAWKAKTVEGATLSAQKGTVPGFVTVTYNGDAKTAQNIRIQMEYMGTKTTDYRGVTTPAGKPVSFGYSHFVAPIAWTVKWFKWDAKAATNTPEGWPTKEAIAALADGDSGELVAQTTTDRLDLAGSGAFFKGLPPEHYATVAHGTFSVPPGDYVLETTTDDGCFVWVDDKPVITNAWKYQGPTPYSASLHLGEGIHTIRVCHFQIDGYAALQVKLHPR